MRILLRSRSLRFTRDMVRQSSDASLACVRWRGREVFYRAGTADPFTLYQVLLRRGKKAEYYLPPALKPKVILDIGSNIGASIIYFHERFAAAKIFGFEPHPETFRVLEKNVGTLPGVTIFNYGVGATAQRISVRADDFNFGAFSTHREFPDAGRAATTVECETRRLDDVLRELGIAHVDLIKIDCEGAEAEVFATLPNDILYRCDWIVGELHDATAFEVLARLAPHFQLDLKKRMFQPRFRFHACNISKVEELRAFDVNALQR